MICHNECNYPTMNVIISPMHVQEYPGVLFKVVIRAGNRSKQQLD